MKYIFILSLFLATYVVVGQSTTEQIFKNLPSGALLIRLTSKSKAIDVLKEKQPKLATKVELEQISINQEIIDAFENGFTLCPVYYFFDYNSEKILNQNFQAVLLDKNLKPVPKIPKLSNNYLIAEFGETLGDSIHMDGEKLEKNSKGDIVSRTDTTYVYYQGNKINALILYTPDFVPVQKPLPRYVRRYVFLNTRASIEMVERLQKKIIDFIN